MTDEDAIMVLQRIESMYNTIRKNDTRFEAVEIAKEALCERIEQNKGCKYCNDGLHAMEVKPCANGITTEVDIGKLSKEDHFGILLCSEKNPDEPCGYVDFNYCPVCGKKVSDSKNGEQK